MLSVGKMRDGVLWVFRRRSAKYVPHLHHWPTGNAEECCAKVCELLEGDSFLYKEVPAGEASLKAWFVREELPKFSWSHVYRGERSIGKNKYTGAYFKPLHWPTVLLASTTLRCALMDYEDTGCKSGTVADFSHTGFSGASARNTPCNRCNRCT